MPFPPSQRVLYERNPLAEVICQLRFPSILRITGEGPATFQDRVRQDYPFYKMDQAFVPQIPKEVGAIIGQFGLPAPQGSVVHRFSAKSPGRVISLSQDFVALSEPKYQQWEQFQEEMRRVVDALEEVYHPGFYTRIGLRYQDVIVRGDLGLENVEWRELVQPYIAGTLAADSVAGAITATLSQTLVRLDEVRRGAQVKLVHGLAVRGPGQETAYVIDSDFSVSDPEGIDEPFTILAEFHRRAGNLFRWAITDRLHRTLGPREI